MKLSVWNQSIGAFDYFEGGGDQAKLNVEKPRHLTKRPLGMTVSQAAWPLPANAVKIGSGPDAIGRIATKKSAAALGDVSLDSFTGVLPYVALAAVAWLVLRKRRSS